MSSLEMNDFKEENDSGISEEALTPVKPACQVCHEVTPSIKPGSLACEACKKFFMRNCDSSRKFRCDNNKKCLQTGSQINRRSCQACRLDRCLAIGLSEKVRPPKPSIDLRFVPCAICGASSTGYHFGILSCEGCKGFFRRSVKYDLAKNFACDSGGDCDMHPLRQKCKKCRFDRCVSAGMTPNGSHIGRHTNAQRAETKRHIEQMQNERKLLKAPIMVRQLKRGATVAALNSPEGTSVEDEKSTGIPSVKSRLDSQPDIKTEESWNPTEIRCGIPQETSPQTFPSSYISGSSSISIDSTDVTAISSPQNISGKSLSLQTTSLESSSTGLQSSANSPFQPVGQYKPPTYDPLGSDTFSDNDLIFPYKSNVPDSAECSKAAMLSRIKMPVTPSSYIWLSGSGSDWQNFKESPHQQTIPPRGSDFSLYTFIRMLDSDNLLHEPSIAMFPRSEMLLRHVVKAVRILSHIKNLRIYFDPGWTAEECWRQGMVCFEHHTRYVLSFVRSLPGYSSLTAPDRALLFTHVLFPFVVAQVSLDYDMEEHEDNFLSMDPIGRELMTLHFPPVRQLRRHIIDAGVGIKSSRLNVVEFGLILAMTFFNPDVTGLNEADKVKNIHNEYKLAVSLFMERTYPNQDDDNRSKSAGRMNVLLQHVRYLSAIFNAHKSLMEDFARLFPHLAPENRLHLEMFVSSS